MGDAAALFREYMGTGLIVIWYMISLIYLWINEKRKYLRLLFLYMPVILLLVYFNPLFARLVYNVAEGEIYYRILWLLPITPVIAYTTVCIYGRFMDRRRADLFALCAVGMIAVSGSFIYSSPLFSKAENVWHMPDSVVHICDAIRVPGREVMALFPLELVSYVRQYDPTICMPYGREMTVDRWHYSDLLRDAMIEEIIDAEKMVPLAREAGCHYCILPVNQKIKGELKEYGWEIFGETDGYIIYRDPVIELVVPDGQP